MKKLQALQQAVADYEVAVYLYEKSKIARPYTEIEIPKLKVADALLKLLGIRIAPNFLSGTQRRIK